VGVDEGAEIEDFPPNVGTLEVAIRVNVLDGYLQQKRRGHVKRRLDLARPLPKVCNDDPAYLFIIEFIECENDTSKATLLQVPYFAVAGLAGYTVALVIEHGCERACQ
jgi:hypothetical protein